MSSMTAELFGDIHTQVRDVVDLYMNENDTESAAEFAGIIQLAKANFEVSISALPENHQADFFDKAVARVVLQKAADVAAHGSNEQAALIKLTLAILYGPEMLKPTNWCHLSVFLDEAAVRLMAVKTRIVDWIMEDDQKIDADTWRDFRVYANLGFFAASLYGELQKSTSWLLAQDLRAIGHFGLRLIAETVRVDKANFILPNMREILFLVVFAWLANSSGFFVNELIRRENLQEIRYWHQRFCDFFDTWYWKDVDYREKISKEVGRFALALSKMNSE